MLKKLRKPLRIIYKNQNNTNKVVIELIQDLHRKIDSLNHEIMILKTMLPGIPIYPNYTIETYPTTDKEYQFHLVSDLNG